MMWILLIGSIIAIVNVILTYNELIPFFAAVKQLNLYTDTCPSFINRFKYPFRFLTLTPKLMPLALDIIVAMAAGSIGLSGGTYGALIGLTIGFTASLLIKFHKHFVAPNIKASNSTTWRSTTHAKSNGFTASQYKAYTH